MTKHILNFFFQELLKDLIIQVPNANADDLEKIASFSSALHSSDTPYAQDLPDFPADSLKNIACILQNNPNVPVYDAIYQIYPYNSLLTPQSISGLKTLFDALKISTPVKDNEWTFFNTIKNVQVQQSETVDTHEIYEGTYTYIHSQHQIKSNSLYIGTLT